MQRLVYCCDVIRCEILHVAKCEIPHLARCEILHVAKCNFLPPRSTDWLVVLEWGGGRERSELPPTGHLPASPAHRAGRLPAPAVFRGETRQGLLFICQIWLGWLAGPASQQSSSSAVSRARACSSFVKSGLAGWLRAEDLRAEDLRI